MPPKTKQIPQLFNELEDQLWWEYKQFDHKKQKLIEDYLRKNKKELEASMPFNFYKCYQFLCTTLGIYPHPQLAKIPSYYENEEKQSQADFQQQQTQEYKEEKEKNGQDGNKFVIIQNQKIDWLTMRLFILAWERDQHFKVIKFSNNDFEEEVLNLFGHFIAQGDNSHLLKLFFDNNLNSLSREVSQKFMSNLAKCNSLQFLTLRSNKIDDSLFVLYINDLDSNLQNLNLKYLELFDNQIGKIGLERLGNFMLNYRKYEYLGFSKNKINSFQDIEELFKKISKQKLTEEELEQRKQLEAQNEALLVKYTKQKKKNPQDLLPKLEPLYQLLDGSPAFMFNPQLQLLNLSMNNLQESDAEFFMKMQNILPETFSVILQQNNFDPKSKDKLRKKLHSNVQV